jgi:hypothetical protein
MNPYEVQSVAIAAPASRVFRFIAEPRNLPRWTHAFKGAGEATALLATPQGSVEIGLAVCASERHGTIDWEMTFPDGAVATACSRLVENGPAASIYVFVLKAPPAAQEAVEGTLARQRAILRDELARLKGLLEQ